MKLDLKKLIAYILTIASAITPCIAWAEFVAKIDRSVLDSNETFRLEMRYDGQVFTGQPDFEILSADFEILSNNRQQSYTSVNGKSESFTSWSLQLRPKSAGILEIPSIAFKGDKSNKIEVRVRTAPTNPSPVNPGSQPIYTETLVDSKQVFVDEQIILTHRLYTSVNLRDYTLSELKINDAVLHRLGDTTFQKVINGRSYLVLEVKYALFPKAIGYMEIPSLRFGAYEVNSQSQYGIFNNRGNPIIRDTQAERIIVISKPSQSAARGWMPSKSVKIEQRWSGDLENVVVGEPITQTITITADGLSPEQITPLDIPQNDKYRIYPDQPQLNQILASDGLKSTRIESLAFVPNQEGEIVFPELRLRWWDLKRQKEAIAILPSTTISVGPSSNVIPKDISNEIGEKYLDNSSESNTILKSVGSRDVRQLSWLANISLGLNAILFAIIIGSLLVRKNRISRRESAKVTKVDSALAELKMSLKEIERAAKNENLLVMRDSILRWGQVLFANKLLLTLKELALELDSKDISSQFEQLDRLLFKDQRANLETFDINLLLNHLRKQSTFSKTANKNKKNDRALMDL